MSRSLAGSTQDRPTTAPARRWAVSLAVLVVGAVAVVLAVVGIADNGRLPGDVGAPSSTHHAPATTGPVVQPPAT
ncbi:MAG TPA: hypothetical protein VJX10_06570 [Pseudonocardiaceae bacterium]|nr:hypothetical protein [Pseudonocardiaceae bacterium]